MASALIVFNYNSLRHSWYTSLRCLDDIVIKLLPGAIVTLALILVEKDFL